MEKPYLVIVDDEKDLLENIHESFETEGYSDILTIKSRTSGEKAVDLAKNAKENNIDVALLLTDMIMPGMKGFQVIEEFKSLFPDIVPMILTGYADKESAIRAINMGEVKAYFEKPWQDPKREIFPKINKFLIKYFSQTKKDIAFVFRQLKDYPQEFEDFFTGRYLVWQHQGWRDPNVQWLDIDEYDFYSEMICAFEQRFDYYSFAGGLRKVDSKMESGNHKIIEEIMRRKRYTFEEADLRRYKELIRKDTISQHNLDELIPNDSPLHTLLEQNQIPISRLLETAFDSPKYEIEGCLLSEYALDENSKLCPLPAMKVHNKKGELDSYIEAIIKEENDRVFTEVGRLGILPKYRGAYHGNVINERLGEESLARFLVEGVSDVIICCHPDQFRFFYKPVGFKPIKGVTEEKYYKLNAPSMAYHLDIRNFFDPEKVNARKIKRDRISIYAEKIEKSIENPIAHVSCMCSNLRECLKEDYLEPIDVSVDYHCPIRAQNFLSNLG